MNLLSVIISLTLCSVLFICFCIISELFALYGVKHLDFTDNELSLTIYRLTILSFDIFASQKKIISFKSSCLFYIVKQIIRDKPLDLLSQSTALCYYSLIYNYVFVHNNY